MFIHHAHFDTFRGFTKLDLGPIPDRVRLVVLAGPNGFGKSSIFDGFRTWQMNWLGGPWDLSYHLKHGATVVNPGAHQAQITFHNDVQPSGQEAVQNAFYFRTANRLEADFSVTSIDFSSTGHPVSSMGRSIDIDTSVSQNYRHLITQGVAGLFGDRDRNVGDIADELIGDVRAAMARIFGTLTVENLSSPKSGGAFYFSKGATRDWHYRNLSGGERAAFDLLLDVAVKRQSYADSIYCIDEPETHLNTRIQSAVLTELLTLMPEDCQMWIATHSIGMLSAAKKRSESIGDVAFLDFEDLDLDSEATLEPKIPDRQFWKRALHVALDDLADLVAPRRVVIVEGNPVWKGRRSSNVEFDAACFRKIFASEFADTEFISVGSSDDVANDSLQLSATTPILAPGAEVLRVVDRDDRNDQEVLDLRSEGVRTLSLRDIESYLLSDEAIVSLCTDEAPGEIEAVSAEAIAHRNALLLSLPNDMPSDDIKAISGDFYNWCRAKFNWRQAGNNKNSFLRDRMTKHVRPGMQIYDQLKSDIFST